MATVTFVKPAHRAVAALLGLIDAKLLRRARCYFSGGTAIVMLLDEYRESRDVDFLCSSADGYRLLRTAVFDAGIAGLFSKPPKVLREVRADQYGIRAIVESERMALRVEVVREARVELEGAMDKELAVPLLGRIDLFTEKLLANADRGLDQATLSRDYIDLVAMQARWGEIPGAAMDKASAAYGQRPIVGALRQAARLLSERTYREKCFAQLQVEPWVRDAVEAKLSVRRKP